MLHMGHTTAERVEELIDGVLQETDDSEHRFKLRTALQLLEMIQEQHEVADQALADSELDETTRENLEGLGYLE